MASLRKISQEDTIMQEGQEGKGEVLGQWSPEDSHHLLISIMKLLPQCDLNPYNIQESQIDWDRVTFASFTADQCREHWNELSNNVRHYRTVSDLVVDALSLLTDPLSQAERIERYNQMINFKPDPINSFNLFIEDSEKTPSQIPYRKRLKFAYQMYRRLSEEEKQWLLEHSDEVSSPSGGRSKKKRTSLKSVYRPHKSKALANPSSSRSRKRRSSMKSVSKPKNFKAMEEESSEQSDNEEEITNPLSGASHFSLKSASRPHKIKAAKKKKKLYMSENCDNGEEFASLSKVRYKKKRSTLKSASRPKKSMAVWMEPCMSSQIDNNEEPSKSTMKERKKKAIHIMMGLSRYVEDSIARYRKKHPEMAQKEIVMELALKWEKLPDRRKNKYWKLALKKYVI